MHPKVKMLLFERDRADERGDGAVARSLTVDLRRLGIPDNATLADPTGKHAKKAVAKPRNKMPKCEHENVAERCVECNPELAAH